MRTEGIVPGSFRDPSGFVFVQDGTLYRQVNRVYQDHYDLLMSSGLYASLTEAGILIPHVEVDLSALHGGDAYKIIRPEPVSCISYPYEWCFSQLKDAALLTLAIQKRALEHGMSLKDASAYNIQFRAGKPVFIDTLSFETYREGQPWVAYRQFCEHFLAPLALMAHTDIRLHRLLALYLDGIPLDLAARLLPWRTRFDFSLLFHLHLHARYQQRYSDAAAAPQRPAAVSRQGLLAVLDSLEGAIRRLRWASGGTEWADYYTDTNYTRDAFRHKQELITEYLAQIAPEIVWDLGANTGVFSRLASNNGIRTVAWDIDPAAVERNYLEVTRTREANILPLLVDLTNPSPGAGWANTERMTLAERGPVDCLFALALIHHLAISNNLPFSRIAAYLARLCRTLVIEFVPKHDSQVQRLLVSREDIFTGYTQEAFEQAFSEYFTILRTDHIIESERTLYLMAVRGG